ncbi:YiiX/YebB-like N1pC/P60 family cysteine hydrolase [Halpernia sp.]|uniref:YiiX/YebB-like N1pC/P60 family cysteine hydrolase n=1 Tax=Halpernia sp. TaxID=2782209 RepID=UPI003A8FC202
MKQIYLIFILVLIQNCTALKYDEIQNGDLLFVEAKKENLSGAISRVTENDNSISFDHIAIAERKNNKINVLDASVKNGSSKSSLKAFLNNHNDTKVVLYRLKSQYQYSISDALLKANSMLGKPYNTAYVLNENSYYCSDFIERSFRDAHIFELKPMTFINPKTGKIDEFWLKFYKNLGLEVPEGKLGCNPNGLSKSYKIKKIKVLN